jgi:hypothetical protein
MAGRRGPCGLLAALLLASQAAAFVGTGRGLLPLRSQPRAAAQLCLALGGRAPAARRARAGASLLWVQMKQERRDLEFGGGKVPIDGDGEMWIRGLDLDPEDESVDEAAWMAAEVCVYVCVSLSRAWSCVDVCRGQTNLIISVILLLKIPLDFSVL